MSHIPPPTSPHFLFFLTFFSLRSFGTACPLSQPFHSNFPSLPCPPCHQHSCLPSNSHLSSFSPPRFSHFSSSSELAILPLPPFLFNIYISAVFPSLYAHRHSSLVPVEVLCCLRLCVSMCHWEIIWKLTARLDSEGASTFIPCSVAMTITHPQPTKAANESMEEDTFLFQTCMKFKEALDNLTHREENR